ncbi:MAG: hypothetical protein KDB63_22450 [Nocardioidaceae bacterium]|nr:hypothetical protein [Nocardioidaceae bacterium]
MGDERRGVGRGDVVCQLRRDPGALYVADRDVDHSVVVTGQPELQLGPRLAD